LLRDRSGTFLDQKQYFSCRQFSTYRSVSTVEYFKQHINAIIRRKYKKFSARYTNNHWIVYVTAVILKHTWVYGRPVQLWTMQQLTPPDAPALRPSTDISVRGTGVYSDKATRDDSVTSDSVRQTTVCACPPLARCCTRISMVLFWHFNSYSHVYSFKDYVDLTSTTISYILHYILLQRYNQGR
jgi:hypothetical protein